MSGPLWRVFAGPERPALLRSLEYVVVDVETTGGSPGRGHRVTEFAAVRVDGTGRVLEEFATLVNPERPIPSFVTRLTGITTAMVREAPRFRDIAHDVRRLLADRIFVAHNASFDRGFVAMEVERAGARAEEMRVLCTLRLARRLVPELRRRSLDALSQHFGLLNEARHRAWGDARVTAELLALLIERAHEQEVASWADLQALLSRPKPRTRRKRTAMPTSMEPWEIPPQ